MAATRSTRPCPLATAAALALLLCGCGGHGSTGEEHRLARGRTVFAHSCTGCHTLTGHDTRASGGDLAIGRLTTAELASFVRVMPVRLSPADVDAVAAYLRAIAITKAAQHIGH
jgi:mono/diheme cytochrome c family protein